MALYTTRRSVLLGMGAMSAATLGLNLRPAFAQNTPQSGGTFRLGISDFSTADTLAVPEGYVAEAIAAWGEPVGVPGAMPAGVSPR